ncbi:MAG TPA: Holliday junction branch migration DNA helicase RuvB, partial [Chlamydiales bacterium]|nr:Holliday junction branch migration DNA helicase RuvB [Chlamydiales bacterium]
MTKRFVESSFCEQDVTFEVPLRPESLHDFVGQEKVREQLEVLIGAAKKRGDVLGHCLFSGPPGLGKTTLSHIISKQMGSQIIVTSGPVLERAGDLAGILTNLKEGDILFIDEIHRLNRTVEEYLYPAMEDFQLDLVVDAGPAARSVKVKLNKFTLIGATTRLGLISAPLRSRFQLSLRLDYYSPDTLMKILQRTASILRFEAEHDALYEIASRSRGTPRISNNLLRWLRDFAEMRQPGIKATKKTSENALQLISIDKCGLDEMDIRLLNVLIDHYNGGPVGLGT